MNRIWLGSTALFAAQLLMAAIGFLIGGYEWVLIMPAAGTAALIIVLVFVGIFGLYEYKNIEWLGNDSVMIPIDGIFTAIMVLLLGGFGVLLGGALVYDAFQTVLSVPFWAFFLKLVGALAAIGCTLECAAFYASQFMLNISIVRDEQYPDWQKAVAALPLGVGTVFGGLLILLRRARHG